MAGIPEENRNILLNQFDRLNQQVGELFFLGTRSYDNIDMSDDDYNSILDDFNSALGKLNKKSRSIEKLGIELTGNRRAEWQNWQIEENRLRQRRLPVTRLNYDYTVTFLNLRDIRFSQSNISLPIGIDKERNITTSMDDYPFKFYNYSDNNLVLLRMFGETIYGDENRANLSFAPTVPSLNVVKNGNCYISIDNRRLELIYRQLCLLLSLNPQLCKIDDLVFKNTKDFLNYELGIPDNVYIYIPCCVKTNTHTSHRLMATPVGAELDKFNTAMRRPEGTTDPIYAGVIWRRVTDPPLAKFKDNPLDGFQMFPATTSNGVSTNEQLNRTNIKIYKNKYPCIDGGGERVPINIQEIINNLVHSRQILMPGTGRNAEEEYDNLANLYYIIANKFIAYLKEERGEDYITKDDLYDNSIKFLPTNLEDWKNTVEGLWEEPLVGGKKNKTRKYISGGTKRKRCKKGSRRHPKTKKCVKNKTKKNKGPIFKIGVDFGGVLAKHNKGEDAEKLEEHKNTQIDMPRAIETLKKLKKNGHDLYIVSFCGKKRALEGKEEIENSGLTNVFTEQIYIKNPFKKGDVLLNFGCNFMIDDRLDLLDKIKLINPDIVTIWFGQKKDDNNTQHICAENWDEVYKIISKTKQFHVPKVETDYKKYLSIKPQAI
jgi:hypothetical protein